MPSFDVVSEVDMMEVKNALEQANKELANRFDFRDAKAEILLEKESIKLSAINQFKIQALEEIVLGKLARRNVSLKNIERKDADISPLGHARQELKLKMGLETDIAKMICQTIRDSKIKVTTQIQDKQVRVTGKDRDALQDVIAMLRAKEFTVALNFTNFPRVKHWLVKSEPESYSFAQFQKDKTTAWTGVRNYTARINLRAMEKGDEIFVYHSVSDKAIVGLATVVKTAYPDPTVEADEKGEWVCVDLKAEKAFPKAVTLETVKAHKMLKEMQLVRQSRLSVAPVSEKEAVELKKLGGL